MDEIATVSNDEGVGIRQAPAPRGGHHLRYFQWGSGCGRLPSGCTTQNKGKVIVVILPDAGERYLSTVLFEEPKPL